MTQKNSNTNYSRQFLKWLNKMGKNLVYSTIPLHRLVINKGQKFVLPRGGVVLDGIDPALILDSEEKVHLPYEHTLLEYTAERSTDYDIGTSQSTKRIVLAHEAEEWIHVSSIWSMDEHNVWTFGPWVAFKKQEIILAENKESTINWNYVAGCEWTKKVNSNKDSKEAMIQDMRPEVAVLFNFMAALSCQNVVCSSPVRDQHKGKKALPFDEYRRLVIKTKSGAGNGSGEEVGERRGPREHMRRGHIRRTHKGDIWINSMVINAGIGGKITKEYGLA